MNVNDFPRPSSQRPTHRLVASSIDRSTLHDRLNRILACDQPDTAGYPEAHIGELAPEVLESFDFRLQMVLPYIIQADRFVNPG